MKEKIVHSEFVAQKTFFVANFTVTHVALDSNTRLEDIDFFIFLVYFTHIFLKWRECMYAG